MSAVDRSSPKNSRLRNDKKSLVSQRFFGLARMILFYVVLVFFQTLFFLHYTQLAYKLTLFALFPGVLLGVCLHIFEWIVSLLKGFSTYFMGYMMAGFLLFFVYLIGYIFIFSWVVAQPFGEVILQNNGSVDIAREYGLYSVNSIIVLAVLSWMKWIKGIIWAPPRKTGNNFHQ